jgi:hypothetical protein
MQMAVTEARVTMRQRTVAQTNPLQPVKSELLSNYWQVLPVQVVRCPVRQPDSCGLPFFSQERERPLNTSPQRKRVNSVDTVHSLALRACMTTATEF